MLNSLAGLIATITNIYTARNKFWSQTAIVTAAITGTCTSILMILFFVDYFWNLRRVKEEHAKLFQAESEVEKEEAT
jgi:predicted membrane protein